MRTYYKDKPLNSDRDHQKRRHNYILLRFLSRQRFKSLQK
uniref:Uncharacterized protein n=1 Tax=Solanum lycopersicum TaxID=4081 RepID=A0A3Q7JAI9_SOLLC